VQGQPGPGPAARAGGHPFDSLASDGLNNPYDPYSTLPEWSSSSIKQSFPADTYAADDGTSNAGRLYSYGAEFDTDRALGSIGSANAVSGGFYHLLRLQNTSGSTIDAINFAYNAEQWRYGGNTTGGDQRFKFQYSLSDGGFWIDVPELDATSTVTSGSAGALDGNTFRTAKSAVLAGLNGAGLNWGDGQYILFRWVDLDDTGSDNGLAIDDVEISAAAGPGVEYATATFTDGTYTQNFDNPPTSMPTDGTAAWVNGSTVGAGWFAYTGNGGARPDLIRADSGGNNAGGVYSYGPGPGDPEQGDRALGSLGSGNPAVGRVTFGVAIQNNTGATITGLDISYIGEQWRRADNTTPQRLDFQYSVDGGVTWVNVNSLDFTGPQTGSTATALDGNLAANQSSRTGSISGISVADGDVILLRWMDDNDAGTDHGLAVDDLVVTVV
jgi:hypothetical protein